MQTTLQFVTVTSLVLVLLPFSGLGSVIPIQRSFQAGSPFTKIQNATRLKFTSLEDRSVITVHKNGDVTTEKDAASPEQRWIVVNHPYDTGSLEFKNEKVEYNMLSGFEDPPENPGLFPRPLGLIFRGMVGKIEAWNIVIRGRWCMQANGLGRSLDIDDCESFTAPWQLWELKAFS